MINYIIAATVTILVVSIIVKNIMRLKKGDTGCSGCSGCGGACHHEHETN